MNDVKVVVTIEGGIIQSVMSNIEEIDVTIVDMDADGVQENELMTAEDITDMQKEMADMVELKYTYNITDTNILE